MDNLLYYLAMFHLKGYRIGLPAIKRFGILDYNHSQPLKRNRHPGLEIHYVLKGEVTWVLNNDLLPLRIPGGFFGIIPANCEHRALGDNGEPAIRLGIIFEAKAATIIAGTPFSTTDFQRILERFTSFGRKPRRITPRLSVILRTLTKSMNLENANNIDGQLALRILSTDLIHETYVALSEPDILAQGQEVIPKICKWIEEHLAENFSVETLIRLSGYGRSRFFSLFLANTGMTPNDYVLRSRIKRAKKELSSRKFNRSILDLAVECGFHSAAAFSKAFRKQVGMSPREYRNR